LNLAGCQVLGKGSKQASIGWVFDTAESLIEDPVCRPPGIVSTAYDGGHSECDCCDSIIIEIPTCIHLVTDGTQIAFTPKRHRPSLRQRSLKAFGHVGSRVSN
jgi:hypothetical protein